MADLILHNGTVITMDPDAPRAEALALAGGRVLATGTSADMLALKRRGTRTADLGGATVTPGFHDAHVHLTAYGQSLGRTDLSGARNLAETLGIIATAEGSGWLLGAGFGVASLGPENLTAATLDALWPDRPVLLRSADHHSAWLNTLALRLTGILELEDDPPGGRIARHPDGTPSGLLYEAAAGLALSRRPGTPPAELRAAAHAAAGSFASLGITTVHHMAGVEEPGSWRAMADAASADGFPVRVWACVEQERSAEAAALGLGTGHGGRRFTIGGAKFFVDGALGSSTAWMLEAYSGSSDTGISLFGQAELHERVQLAAAAGLAPVIHAIGDAAVKASLDALEATRETWQANGLRPRLEHAQHITRSDVRRCAELGIIVSAQPIHLPGDAAGMEAQLGTRTDRAFVFREFLDAGVPLAFGSDAPIAPPAVPPGLTAAVERTDTAGRVFHGSQALTPEEALHAFTAGAAYAAGQETWNGRLSPGFAADVTVLDGNPLEDPGGITVLLTLLDGRVTYDSAQLSEKEH